MVVRPSGSNFSRALNLYFYDSYLKAAILALSHLSHSSLRILQMTDGA